jgi:hypothetical protein
MARVDDLRLSGHAVILLRRIPPWPDRVTWGDDGPRFSTLNFKDKDDELSLFIAAETTAAEVLTGHEEFGLIQITAQYCTPALPGPPHLGA